MTDCPWASAWDDPSEEVDITWSADVTSQWPATGGTAWLQGDAPWGVQSQDKTSELDITQDHRGISQLPSPAISEPSSETVASVSDHQVARSSSPPRDSVCLVSETSDVTPHDIASIARASDEENILVTFNPLDGDWCAAWGTTSSSEANLKENQPPDQWEAARQEKEKLNRAVPPGLLDSLLRHCQQVSQEVWPASETSNGDGRNSGFDELADIAALLAQLLPVDSTLPPIVQFSETATAKGMNEALRLTRHLPASASSPLSRLLASKGSLEWEKSIHVKQDVSPDTSHVGWRVLEKEDRLSAAEESKPRKATGGLLSFWNRRASTIQAASVETLSEGSRSPARSSLENAEPVSHPPPSQVASPSKSSTPFVPPPLLSNPQFTVVPIVSAPSAVSRFLNRFSRTKGAQHVSLALSSDDLEFLSDIAPSASDPPDDDIDDGALDSLTSASISLPLPPKLPPPIPPPSKQPRPSSEPRTLGGVSAIGSAPTASQMQGASRNPDVPVLIPPLSPKPAASFSRIQSPLSPKDVATPTITFQHSNTPSMQQGLQPSPQANSNFHSSFTVPPSQKVLPSLSIPPLLPPPPVSPPQTPRPGAFPPITTPDRSSTTRSTDISTLRNSDDFDDEFTAFSSFPSSVTAPCSSSDPYPSQISPSPPSPPPRRTYDRTHYPRSSSITSILSPTSQTSEDQLYSTRSSASASLDSFDDFVSPPSVVRGERIPSPPSLPVKPQSQHWKPSRIDTVPSRVYHAHLPSQTFVSPTIHTSLMNDAFSIPPVSDAEHQRTQSLVNHAAARGGLLWPNSPATDEQEVIPIPPPPLSSTPPKSFTGGEPFDLLGDSYTLEALPSPPSVVGGVGVDSTVSSPATSAPSASFGVVGPPGREFAPRNPRQPSSPLQPSTSTPILSFSSLGTPLPVTTTNTGSSQGTKPKQTGGLSAQDLSFFEGL